VSRGRVLIACVGATFMLLALAVAVDAGKVAGFDQWSVTQLMPLQDHPTGEPSALDRATSPLAAVERPTNSALTRSLFAVTVPFAPLPAVLLAGAGAFVLVIRGRRRAAAAWCGALAAALIVEAAFKHVVERPLVYKIDSSTHLARPADTLNRSFPSGHAVRAVVLAGLVLELAPGLASIAFAAAGITSALTVVLSMHTPTDVSGGLLLGFILLAVGWLGARPGGDLPRRAGEPRGHMRGSPRPFRSQRVE